MAIPEKRSFNPILLQLSKVMKKLLFFLLFFSIATVYGQNPAINVIPQPVEIQQSAGSFILTGNATLGFNSQESREIAGMLAQKLNLPTGFSIKPQIEAAGKCT